MDTAGIIHRFNEAFQRHNPDLLPPLVAEDCVIENTTPAPSGELLVGREACLANWQGIASNKDAWFVLEKEEVFGDRAIILWRYCWGQDEASSVRGVNIMRVRDGKIVEVLGYVKG